MSDAMAVHEAYKRGDLEALKSALGHPPDFPNSRGPIGIAEHCLEYAIYHSPLPFIQTLLELGANPNYPDLGGFSALMAALSTERQDKYNIIELLLSFGADIQQRGVNDWTPLHYAAAANDTKAIELLLSHGADPKARTNVDDFTTALEEAENLDCADAVEALRKFGSSSGPGRA